MLADAARRHIGDVLLHVIGHREPACAVVVFDTRCELAVLVSSAYRACLPNATFVDFDAVLPDAVLRAFEPLNRGDLVVLVQSSNFRLEAFRIRVELFKRGLAVIEHPHLERMAVAEIPAYIESLAYDPSYYRTVGPALKARIDCARRAVVDSGGALLTYDSPFEPAKLNIGDYSAMPNVGGQFPIGEVFTEPRDLEAVNGRIRIFAFGDSDFRVNTPAQPITLVVHRGRIVAVEDSTEAFDRLIAMITASEGEVWIRELGFGLNRAFSRERRVNDVGTYERMCGIHLSLGAKHAIFKKANFNHKAPHFHIDVFAVTEFVLLDDEIVYRDGAWSS